MANGFEAKEMEVFKSTYAQVLKQTATVLSTILRLKSQIGLQDVSVLGADEIVNRYPQQQLIVRFSIVNEVQGQGILVFSEDISRVLCDISTGGSGKNPPAAIGENELNVLKQLTSQFLTALSAAMYQTLNRKITLSSLDLKLSTFGAEGVSVGTDEVVVVNSRLSLEGVSEGQLIQVFPLSIGRELAAGASARFSKSGQRVEPLNLSPLDKTGSIPSGDMGSLLVDIPLQLSVELGRTRMPLKDVLELGVGSIIELERLSGEPVDIMLNNKPLAKGEVVIIDENIGVRLTHIINPNERV
jgi:flagellar motor switch protein FliN